MIHVFIVGSKGIPAQYGGFETFVEQLTLQKKSSEIHYHVSCMNADEGHFVHNGADCFNVRNMLPGPIGRVLHVSRALNKIEKWRKNNFEEKVIVYILGCRIGPFLIPHSKKLHRLNIKILCNPDGLEWKRSKWNWMEKQFLKICEKSLVNCCDLVICDSRAIEGYIRRKYKKVKTTYISYGAELGSSICTDDKFQMWCNENRIKEREYYLTVGRFVPENNFETILREFIASNTRKNLVIITNVEKNCFYKELLNKVRFDKDKRVKFVGTVYEKELLKKIREGAHAYIHGHEVGGTNPSLLEAMASTDVNLLFDVEYNREVAGDAALYWKREEGSLKKKIEWVDKMEKREKSERGIINRNRIATEYTWENIVGKYENLFIEYSGNVRSDL